jgi:hypothetical protein
MATVTTTKEVDILLEDRIVELVSDDGSSHIFAEVRHYYPRDYIRVVVADDSKSVFNLSFTETHNPGQTGECFVGEYNGIEYTTSFEYGAIRTSDKFDKHITKSRKGIRKDL